MTEFFLFITDSNNCNERANDELFDRSIQNMHSNESRNMNYAMKLILILFNTFTFFLHYHYSIRFCGREGQNGREGLVAYRGLNNATAYTSSNQL